MNSTTMGSRTGLAAGGLVIFVSWSRTEAKSPRLSQVTFTGCLVPPALQTQVSPRTCGHCIRPAKREDKAAFREKDLSHTAGQRWP